MTHFRTDGRFFLKLRNFGPIKEASLDVRPLTILLGRSNTGKTYFTTLLYALHNMFGGFPKIPLSNLNILEFKSIANTDQTVFFNSLVAFSKSQNSPLNLPTFQSLPKFIQNELIFSKQNRGKFIQKFSQNLITQFSVDSASELRRQPSSHSEPMTIFFQYVESGQEIWSAEFVTRNSMTLSHSNLLNPINLSTETEKILNLTIEHLASNNERPSMQKILANIVISRLAHPRKKGYSSVHYLPATRSGLFQHNRILSINSLRRRSMFEDPSLIIPDAQIAFLTNILEASEFPKSYLKDADSYRNSIVKTSQEIEHRLLDGQIQLKFPGSGNYPDFKFSPRKIKKIFSMQQSSSMISEIAPIVITLRYLVNPNDLLIIEEPEAHLHPSAQIALVQCLVKLVNCGVNVFVTTHSDWILRAVHNLVLRGAKSKVEDENGSMDQSGIAKEDIGVWEFLGSKDDLGTVAREIAVGRDGLEPTDFLEIDTELYNDEVLIRHGLDGDE